ncbi:MAG: serine/threonine protein kinase [Methylococcales bacterium]|nr:serine/threonine protein kinase [Methylococcales bacterium]
MTHPTKIGKYDILSTLGSGNMGVVYRAHDPEIGRDIAIKMIHASMLNQDAEREKLLRQFKAEVQAVGQISQRNIVPIYEYGEMEDGSPYFVMELIQGLELHDHIKKKTVFSFEQMTHLMQEVLRGLQNTHERGIIHLDIKPRNIFLTDCDSGASACAKIADFGIAKLAYIKPDDEDDLTGTPLYMSPEQFLQETLDGRSDLFSTAVVFYELATGKRPFSNAVTLREIFLAVMKTDPIPPSELNPSLPKSFDDVMLKALQKKPEHRYQTALEFSQAVTQSYESFKKSQVPLVKRLSFYGPVLLGFASLVSVFLFSSPDIIVLDSSKAQVVLSVEQQKKVIRLLKVAKAHEITRRYLKPHGSSAFDAYQQILLIDPLNKAAHIGLQNIVGKIISNIEMLYAKGLREHALQSLELAKGLFPKNEALGQLEDTLFR